MAYVLRQLYGFYKYYMVEYSDPRSENLPLVSFPMTYGILVLYLYGVLNLGPRLMRKRPPFHIKNLLIVYNAFQIIANIYVWLYIVYWTYYQGTFNWRCNPAPGIEDTSEVAQKQVNATYLYFLLKLLDLLDTVFFVLRKRATHVSFLHVYHHTAMVFAGWIAIRFVPAGHGTMVGVLNCFVHAIMYGYYLACVLNENVKQSFWWKKYITQIQMVQFMTLVLHFGQTLVDYDCAYPKLIAALMTTQNVCMLFMFADFYRTTYLKKKLV